MEVLHRRLALRAGAVAAADVILAGGVLVKTIL